MYIQEELSIKPMTISQVYSLYRSNKLIVNRKYQRKLCWSIEEKRNFLDTIERGLPVPMFLFAAKANGQYEIIDGMQRLDAICSFIVQRYNLKDGNFNLESMPDTIEEKRQAIVTQRFPVLDSTVCKNIANYPLPVSVFPAAADDEVEEIFKRINSTGRHLALQELRQVGVDTQFSNLIRILSSEIRGDISEDILLLKNMSNISLSNYRLPYSINLNDVFWTKNGIINYSEMRQSRDEEAIMYLLANMILPSTVRITLTASSLNKFYGYSSNPLDNTVPLEMTQIDNAVNQIGSEAIKKQFRTIISCIQEMIESSQKTFRKIIGAPNSISDLIVPFGILFMAVYILIIRNKMTVIDYDLFAKKLEGNCEHILISNGDLSEEKIDTIVGLIQPAFKRGAVDDPALDNWSQNLLNILNKSRTEQVLYDFKIGCVPLGKSKIDLGIVAKILKTLTAINNSGPNRVGYVIVGVADKEQDAQAYQAKYRIPYTMINDLALCGIENDAIATSQSIDSYTHSIKEQIRACSNIPHAYAIHLLTNMKVIMAYSKHVMVFKTCYTEPVAFDNEFYLREFTDVNKLEQSQIGALYKNYYGK